MKVTGNDLISAVEQHKFRLETFKQEFTDSLYAFAGETKRLPKDIMVEVAKEELAIAVLQAAQAKLNGMVQVRVVGKGVSAEGTYTLAEAVKMVGGVERVHAMWKSAMVEKDSYGYRDLTRDPSQVRATRQIDNKTAAEHAAQAKLYQRALRAAIVTGNRQTVELDLEPSLLD